MSGKRIVEIVELCEHGRRVHHLLPHRDHERCEEFMCEQSRRRTLTEDEFADTVNRLVQGSIDALKVPNLILAPGAIVLDALSDHTEGTP